MKWVCFWRPILFEKSQKVKIQCITLFSCSKTYDIIVLPEVDQTHKKFWTFFGSLWTHKRNKCKNFCGFGPLQAKRLYHTFSSIKMKECMQFELSQIFLCKTADQKYWISAAWCLFLKKHANVVNQTVGL